MVTLGDFLFILVVGLASFRLTRLVVFDKITEFIRSPFFEESTELDENGKEVIYLIPKEGGVKGWIGQLLSCYWCTGIWMSAILIGLNFFVPSIGEPVILVLAVAAVGSIIETVITHVLNG